jgi:hypothetical protein
VVVVAAVSGVRKRDEGYRPLVLLQRQRKKQADSVTSVFRASFGVKCSWSSGKEILKSYCNFRNENLIQNSKLPRLMNRD